MHYVLSDIHGQYEVFEQMLNKLNLKSDDTLYILGDIIDRGPEVGKVIDTVMSLKNVQMIVGNHEYMMLESFKGNLKLYNYLNWKQNGCKTTLKDFNEFSKEKQDSIIDYFSSLPYKIEVDINGTHFILVHGYYIEERLNITEKWKYNTVWKRYEPFEQGPADAVVVFGHTPTWYYQKRIDNKYMIWHGEHLIGIDCGLAGRNDKVEATQLGCLCLETMEEFYTGQED